jgi:hypothetical protein
MGFVSILSGGRTLSPVTSAHAAEAASAPGVWLAEQVRGTVRIRTPGLPAHGWQRLEADTAIAPDSEVATGSDGLAILASGTDRIRLSPNSHIVLPGLAEEAGFLTIIRQKLGSVFFDVETLPQRRFEVDAPFLVVLVKGTKFTVHANFIANGVDVHQGDVDVRPADDDGAWTSVAAGETARIFGGGDTVNVAPGEPGGKSGPTGQGKGGAEPRPVPSEPRRANAGGNNGGGQDNGGGDDGGENGGQNGGGCGS